MKWIKRGLIFNPTDHGLDFDCTEYAQSPQTLVFDDFVRIYFSTRKRDLSGKFLSNIAFVDFDHDFSKIINHSRQEVIRLGELGCFDEHGIFPMNLLHRGNIIWAYTCGWSRRTSVSVETSTGLAMSEDGGLTFRKLGSGPVLTSSLHEPMLVGDSFVKNWDETFHMWYIFGKKWILNEGTAERVYKIAYATSNDGIYWMKEDGKQIVEDVIDENECQALPTVIKIGSGYHMIFCFRHAFDFRMNPKNGYRLGYAFSDDLKSWVRRDNEKGIDVSVDGWDAEMMCYPHLFDVKGKVFLLYNGNEFGRCGFGLAQLESI